MNPVLVALFAPFYPTRRAIEAGLGHDPAKLARLSAATWRLFRMIAVGCLAGWLVVVGALAGLAWTGLLPPDDWAFVRRLGLATTAVFGMAVLVNYPWPFREQGSRWVRWLVLAVGVPSLCVFAAGLFGLL